MTARTSELARLEDLIGRQPGVAAVIGPREQQSVRLTGAFLSSSGDAARYAVIFDHDPLAGRDRTGPGPSVSPGRLRSAPPRASQP